MANLIQFQNKYSENLLSIDSLLKNNPTLNYSGNGSANFDTQHAITDKANSLELLAIQNIIFGVEERFDFGETLAYQAEQNGNYAFQFAIKIRNVSSDPNYTVNMGLEVYIDDVLIHTYVKPLDLTIYENDTFVFMSQSFFLVFEQVVNFKFTVIADSVGSPNPNFNLNFSGFKIEVLDKNTDGLPTNYSLPRDYCCSDGKQMFGVWNYDNSGANQSIVATIWTHILNNGSGANTILGGAYPDVNIYDTSTSLLDFTDLNTYDTVLSRFDANVTTTTANQVVIVRLVISYGDLNIPLTFIYNTFKTAGTYPLFGELRNNILSESVKTNPARFEIWSDDACTLDVNGWSLEAIKQFL